MVAGRKHIEVDDDVRHGSVTCTRTLMTSPISAVTSPRNVQFKTRTRTKFGVYGCRAALVNETKRATCMISHPANAAITLVVEI